MAGLTIIKVLLQRQKHIFLYCNASNLVLKILQHDKNLGDNHPTPNSGGLVVIYAHGSLALVINGLCD